MLTFQMKYIPSDIIERLKNLNTEDVAMKLGMTVVKHRTLCFMHQDTHPSLSFMKNEHGWKCFVCNCGGYDAISFVRKFLKCDYLGACHWLCQAYSICLPDKTAKRNVPRVPLKTTATKYEAKTGFIPSEKYYDIISWIIDKAKLSNEAADFLYMKRCLNQNVIQNLQIGSVSDPERLVQKLLIQFSEHDLKEAGIIKTNFGRHYLRIYTPCILFPYYDINKNIIGLQSRYIGNNANAPRFQFIGCKNIPIFNLPIVKQMNKGDDLYIAEGVTDCMALLSDGKKAVAIPSASNIPDECLNFLVDFRLHMYPDQDNGAGIRAYRNVRSKLISMGGFLYKEELPEGFKDYGEYYQYKCKKSNEGAC